MTQKNGKESLEDFVKRNQDDALTKISNYNRYVQRALQDGSSGLTVADLGSKISNEEGRLDILRSVAYLIDDKRA